MQDTNVQNFQTWAVVSDEILNNGTMTLKTPATLANMMLAFEFYNGDIPITTNTTSGTLAVTGSYKNGRSQSIAAVNLATSNEYPIYGVYDSLTFNLSNLVGCTRVVVYAVQYANIINGTGGGGGGDSNYIYKGTYNAATNTPPLANGVGTLGWWYIVTVAGSNNPTGALINANQTIAYNGSIWEAGAQINDTDELIVSTNYVAIPEQNIEIGQNLTYALGTVQGNIDAIRNTNIPIRIVSNTNVNTLGMIVITPYTYVNVGVTAVTLTLIGGSEFINPLILNGSATTLGINPGEVVTLTKQSDNLIFVS